eukprot:514780-Amorphochlora_amoeboformis.AAC.1
MYLRRDARVRGRWVGLCGLSINLRLSLDRSFTLILPISKWIPLHIILISNKVADLEDPNGLIEWDSGRKREGYSEIERKTERNWEPGREGKGERGRDRVK